MGLVFRLSNVPARQSTRKPKDVQEEEEIKFRVGRKMGMLHSNVQDDMEYVHKQLIDNLDRVMEDCDDGKQKLMIECHD